MRYQSSKLKRRTGLFILGLLLSARLCADAAVYFVNQSADGAGRRTLRGAVAAANKNPNTSSTIVLTETNYHLVALGYGDMLTVVAHDLTIIGGQGRARDRDNSSSGNSGSVTVDSSYMTRFFYVLPGAKLTLKNLTLTGGGFYAEKSGALKNEGTLILDDCQIVGNNSILGAGIYNSGNLMMNRVIVANNICDELSGGEGGGIYNIGTLTAISCTISNNRSGNGWDGGYSFGTGLIITTVGGVPSAPGGNAGGGGGVFNGGIMTLNKCFITGNSTGRGGNAARGNNQGANGGDAGDGGGIYNAGDLTIRRCTITDNNCGMGGSGANGGLSFYGNMGYNGGNGGNGGSSGGIFNAPRAHLKTFNSLVALNESGAGGGAGPGFIGFPGYVTAGSDGLNGADGFSADVSGDFISLGYNLIGEGDNSTGFTNQVNHDIVGTSAAPAAPQLYKAR